MRDKILALLGGIAFTLCMYALVVGMIILGG